MSRFSTPILFLILLPLFAGPFLAGMMQANQASIVGLWGMFVVAQFLGGALTGKRGFGLILTALSTVAVQLGLVAFSFAAGWVIGKQSGLSSLPPALPYALTGLGVVIFAIAARRGKDPDISVEPVSKTPSAPDDYASRLRELGDDYRVWDIDPIIQQAESDLGYGFIAAISNDIGRSTPAIDAAVARFLMSGPMRQAAINANQIAALLDAALESPHANPPSEALSVCDYLIDENVPKRHFPSNSALTAAAATHTDLSDLVERIKAYRAAP